MKAKHLTRVTLAAVLTALLLTPLSAADQNQKKKKRKKPQRKDRVVNVVRLPKAVQETLTEEQKKQIAALNKEYGPQLTELRKQMGSIITPDQRKAQREAFLVARKAGKKGKELREAVEAAAKITDEQKKQLAEVRKKMADLQKEIRTKVLALLTDEQKAKLKPVRKKGKSKKPRKKKSDA